MTSIIIHIENGIAKNGNAIRKFFTTLKNGRYELSAKKLSSRSTQQNRYYWGCVVQMIKERLIELGNDVDSETVHTYLKDRFNSIELFDKDGVIIGSVGSSTTKLSKTDFELYLEKVKQFAAEVLDIYIPDPNEQLNLI